MISHTNRIVYSILAVVAFGLLGCSKSTVQSPPKQDVQNAVAVALPPFLSLDSIELEPISTGPESVKVNFKAIAAPKEALFQLDREVEGTPKVTLLKMVQAAGTKLTIYGCVKASLTMDKWTLESPQIQNGLNQFGTTRGTFDAQSYVTGSSEAKAALKQQTTNAELQQQAKKAAFEQEESERIAREAQLEQARQVAEGKHLKDEEQRKKEEESVRQKVLLATVPGKRYVGTLSTAQSSQRLSLTFTEQNGFLIRAQLSNPDISVESRVFTGEILAGHKDPHDQKAHQIRMSPADGGYNATQDIMHKKIGGTALDQFYFDQSRNWTVDIDLTETGLEGSTSGGLKIRLQP